MANETSTDRQTDPRADREEIGRRWGFSVCCAIAFERLADVLDAEHPVDGAGDVTASPAADLPATVLVESLSHSAVGPALADYVLEDRAGGDPRLTAFAERLVADVPDRAAPRLLLALDAERRGDAAGAEDRLREAHRNEPGYAPVASELASYEVDRSQVDRALALLRHPELKQETPTRRFLDDLRRAIAAPYRNVGRNDRCPCGSGRKFKMCCDGNPVVRPAQRLQLLYHKVALFAGRPHRRARLIELAAVAAGDGGDDRRDELARHPAIFDFAVFEGGVGQEYRRERGLLLPEDEQELFADLLDEPRRLWTIVDVRPGEGFTFREVGTDLEVRVDEDRASAEQSVGDAVLARLARAGDAHHLVGVPVHVPDEDLASTRELMAGGPDAEALAAWYGGIAAGDGLDGSGDDRSAGDGLDGDSDARPEDTP